MAGLGLCGVFVALALGGTCRTARAQDTQARPEALKRMPIDADPSYEVATVKPSNPDDHNRGIHRKGRHFGFENATMNSLLTFAYGIHSKQLADAPAWFASDRYDIDGVLDAVGKPDLMQMQSVMKKLLADRFQLRFHHGTRKLSVYALVVAKDGPRLTKSKSDPNSLGDAQEDEHGGEETLTITNLPIADFALIMQFFMDRPVVDQTRLQGRWDFKWTWTVDESRVATDANAAPGVFTAIQEQLGLKLVAKKAPADVFVVDHVERPSPN